ncbi:MAG: LamG domain-containing protein [Pyrinomonadaceae bacterium MAG19_C2-C3]|nr:LamG domain-containing protein [Pyrinomonadaceae bacterium MAG19_C2-C3]
MPSTRLITTPVLSILLLCLVFLTITQRAFAQSCVQPPAGLVSWFPGEGNANDIQGNNNGTLQNGATFAAGRVGQAFSFDGVDDYVRVSSSGIVKGLGEATVEAWVKLKGTHGLGNGVVWIENTSALGFTRFGLFVRDNGIVRVLGRDQATENFEVPTKEVASQSTIPLNLWTHLAGTWKAGEGIKVYINGQLDNQFSDPNLGSFTNTNSAFIGIGRLDDRAGTRDEFNGDVDETSVFTRALSASEIQAIYNADSAGKCPPGGLASLTLNLQPSTADKPRLALSPSPLPRRAAGRLSTLRATTLQSPCHRA